MSKVHLVDEPDDVTICGRPLHTVELFTRNRRDFAEDYDLDEICIVCAKRVGLTRRQVARIATGKTRYERAADLLVKAAYQRTDE